MSTPAQLEYFRGNVFVLPTQVYYPMKYDDSVYCTVLLRNDSLKFRGVLAKCAVKPWNLAQSHANEL